MVVTHTQKSMNCKQSLFLQHVLQKSLLKFFLAKQKNIMMIIIEKKTMKKFTRQNM